MRLPQLPQLPQGEEFLQPFLAMYGGCLSAIGCHLNNLFAFSGIGTTGPLRVDFMENDLPFGGKLSIDLGDFKEIILNC